MLYNAILCTAFLIIFLHRCINLKSSKKYRKSIV
nr:MAG TPA: hypothetical protein [Caudoviricetes sp.]DAY59436.1 MAG TPA: hypothetical protein [Caudoviricetes sp.]